MPLFINTYDHGSGGHDDAHGSGGISTYSYCQYIVLFVIQSKLMLYNSICFNVIIYNYIYYNSI